eukprot:242452_1
MNIIKPFGFISLKIELINNEQVYIEYFKKCQYIINFNKVKIYKYNETVFVKDPYQFGQTINVMIKYSNHHRFILLKQYVTSSEQFTSHLYRYMYIQYGKIKFIIPTESDGNFFNEEDDPELCKSNLLKAEYMVKYSPYDFDDNQKHSSELDPMDEKAHKLFNDTIYKFDTLGSFKIALNNNKELHADKYYIYIKPFGFSSFHLFRNSDLKDSGTKLYNSLCINVRDDETIHVKCCGVVSRVFCKNTLTLKQHGQIDVSGKGLCDKHYHKTETDINEELQFTSDSGIIELIAETIVNYGEITANCYPFRDRRNKKDIVGAGGVIKIQCKKFINKGVIEARAVNDYWVGNYEQKRYPEQFKRAFEIITNTIKSHKEQSKDIDIEITNEIISTLKDTDIPDAVIEHIFDFATEFGLLSNTDGIGFNTNENTNPYGNIIIQCEEFSNEGMICPEPYIDANYIYDDKTVHFTPISDVVWTTNNEQEQKQKTNDKQENNINNNIYNTVQCINTDQNAFYHIFYNSTCKKKSNIYQYKLSKLVINSELQLLNRHNVLQIFCTKQLHITESGKITNITAYGIFIELISDHIIHDGEISCYDDKLFAYFSNVKIKCKRFVNKGIIKLKTGEIFIECEEYINEGTMYPAPTITYKDYIYNQTEVDFTNITPNHWFWKTINPKHQFDDNKSIELYINNMINPLEKKKKTMAERFTSVKKWITKVDDGSNDQNEAKIQQKEDNDDEYQSIGINTNQNNFYDKFLNPNSKLYRYKLEDSLFINSQLKMAMKSPDSFLQIWCKNQLIVTKKGSITCIDSGYKPIPYKPMLELIAEKVEIHGEIDLPQGIIVIKCKEFINHGVIKVTGSAMHRYKHDDSTDSQEPCIQGHICIEYEQYTNKGTIYPVARFKHQMYEYTEDVKFTELDQFLEIEKLTPPKAHEPINGVFQATQDNFYHIFHESEQDNEPDMRFELDNLVINSLLERTGYEWINYLQIYCTKSFVMKQEAAIRNVTHLEIMAETVTIYGFQSDVSIKCKQVINEGTIKCGNIYCEDIQNFGTVGDHVNINKDNYKYEVDVMKYENAKTNGQFVKANIHMDVDDDEKQREMINLIQPDIQQIESKISKHHKMFVLISGYVRIHDSNAHIPSSVVYQIIIFYQWNNILVVGHGTVGKTSLLQRYINNRFEYNCQSTHLEMRELPKPWPEHAKLFCTRFLKCTDDQIINYVDTPGIPYIDEMFGNEMMTKQNLDERTLTNLDEFDQFIDEKFDELMNTMEHKMKEFETTDDEKVVRMKELGVKYLNVSAIIYVYDVNNYASFEYVEKYRKAYVKINEFLQRNIGWIPVPIMLLGNKCDWDDNLRKVPKKSVEKYAKKKNNIIFHEVSAANDINVTKAFESIQHKIMQ